MQARLFAILLVAASAAAQRPLFDPDDFLDPALHTKPVFLSRLVFAGVGNPTDHFRPLPGNSGFILLTNTFYVDRFQFDYKHTEVLSGDDPEPLRRCDCPDPVYFPTPQPDAAPQGPSAERSDTLQLAYYRSSGMTRRYRLSYQRQEVETTVTSAITGEVLERRTGRDQSLTVDADTYLRLFGVDVWGTLYYARTWISGTPNGDGVQNEFVYVYRPPGWSVGDVLLRARVGVGVLSDRGATGLNLVNPSFEAFWRHHRTKVNFHVVYSPAATKSGEGWETNHEVAFFVDRTLYLKVFDR